MTEAHRRAGTEPAPDVVRLCHDLKQYVAAGRLLLDAPMVSEADRQARWASLAHLMETMGEILEESGGGDRRLWWLDLGQIVRECVEVTRLTSTVSIVCDVPEGAAVYGNAGLTRRAVSNLLANAARAAGPDGLVTVRLRQEPGESLVEVVDTGDGFGRMESISGYGMSVVDAAMRAARGRLEISSDPGEGTLVRLRIPVGGVRA
ncbi:hypothetical protein GCM10027425_15730 [Alteromonas gracilis]